MRVSWTPGRQQCPLLVVLAVLAATVVLAQEDAPEVREREERPRHCISLARIDRIEILDEQNLLFHMTGKQIYRNHLPHKCPSLSKGDTLMYRTWMSQLCNVDIITVLESIGFGFSPGISCGLGMFHPVDPGAADLKSPLD